MNTLKKILTGLTFSTLCVAFTGSATPIVTSWEFIVDSSFTSSLLAPGSGTGAEAGGGSAVGSDTNGIWSAPSVLSWGDTGGLVGLTDSDVSSISITGTAADPDYAHSAGTVITDGAPAHISTLTHMNNSISIAYATLASATLESILILKPLLPFAGADVGIPSLDFGILFKETLNSSGSCITGSATVCDDIFVISLPTTPDVTVSFDPIGMNFVFSQIFEVGSHHYMTHLLVNGLMPLGAEICGVASAPGDCIGFTTGEGGPNHFDVAIQVSLIPEPSSILLMSIALLGIAGSLRNKHI